MSLDLCSLRCLVHDEVASARAEAKALRVEMSEAGAEIEHRFFVITAAISTAATTLAELESRLAVEQKETSLRCSWLRTEIEYVKQSTRSCHLLGLPMDAVHSSLSASLRRRVSRCGLEVCFEACFFLYGKRRGPIVPPAVAEKCDGNDVHHHWSSLQMAWLSSTPAWEQSRQT